MKKQTIKMTALTAALLGTITVGGVMAYFTDGDTTTNTFTVGKISIDLQEPNWVPAIQITPEQEIAKNPQVKNDGINDAFIFIKVSVPYENVVTANEDGTKNKAADTELFSYDVNDCWTELVSEQVKDANTKTVSHLYAYVGVNSETGINNDKMMPVASGKTTPTLFDYVRFVNIVEDQELEEKSLDIVINAYAIQTVNLEDNKTSMDGNNDKGTVDPLDVWKILESENPSLDSSVEEETNTDIKL